MGAAVGLVLDKEEDVNIPLSCDAIVGLEVGLIVASPMKDAMEGVVVGIAVVGVAVGVSVQFLPAA